MAVADLRLRQLEAFVLVAQLGSFRAAAARLDLSQPAVSQRIADLERAIGVRLIERGARACRLTPRGRRFETGARRLLDAAAALRQEVADPANPSGHVQIGIADSVAVTWFPDFLARLRARLPGVTVDVEIDLTAALARRLAALRLDLLCGIEPMIGSGFARIPIGEIALAWVASPRLGLGGRIVTPEILADQPIIGHTGGHHEAMIRHWFRGAGRTPRWMSGCTSLAAIIDLACAGVGLSLIPPRAVAARIAAGELEALVSHPPVPPNRLCLAHPPGPLAPETQAVAELMLATARDWLAAPAAWPAPSPARARRRTRR
jgi:DNA-binding transcriptional LysR family regulator